MILKQAVENVNDKAITDNDDDEDNTKHLESFETPIRESKEDFGL